MGTKDDVTSTGLRVVGAWENDRNVENAKLYKSIIREVFGVTDVIIGHHLVYEVAEKRSDNFTYQIVEEIPSADALIFCHDVAKKLWGVQYKMILARLAIEPEASRDALLQSFYNNRRNITAVLEQQQVHLDKAS